MLHIIHIVRDLDIASGGPSRSVPALAESQSEEEGIKVTVLYRDRGNPVVELDRRRVDYKTVTVRNLLLGKTFLSSLLSKYLLKGNCIFHLHGLWSPTLHWAAVFAARNGVPFAISTRGMLATWCLGHKSFKKKLGWWVYQQRDIERAACLLATSEPERDDVLTLVPGKQVAVIPNGCKERPEISLTDSLLPENAGIRWALAMGRLHPVKGFAELIDAWSKIMPVGWKLAIAGPDEDGYRTILENLVSDHGLAEQVLFLGEVDDQQKWALLDRSELLVAPSKSENFGMAIAEALQSGTPVIATTGTPWSEIVEYRCGWWVAPDIDSLGPALLEATATDAIQLREMGRNGHRLIAEKYSWTHIGRRTIELYNSILGS